MSWEIKSYKLDGNLVSANQPSLQGRLLQNLWRKATAMFKQNVIEEKSLWRWKPHQCNRINPLGSKQLQVTVIQQGHV